MTYCDCGRSAIDLEEHYQRGIGETSVISVKKNINGTWVKVN